MELRKYTPEKIVELDRTRAYVQDEVYSAFTKPRGFWVSVMGEDDWKNWCTDNEFWTERLINEQKIELSESANILYLNNDGEMLEFQEKYGQIDTSMAKFGFDRPSEYYMIDWGLVAREYDGIIIPNFSWRMRNDMWWYSGWDCSSGCIWSISAIKSVTRAPIVLLDVPRPSFKSIEELLS